MSQDIYEWVINYTGVFHVLAQALLFLALWGIFYPELCFTEETCAAVTSEEAQANDLSVQEEATGARGVPGAETGVSTTSEQIEASEVWHASGDEIVISSRLLEWLEESLSASKD